MRKMLWIMASIFAALTPRILKRTNRNPRRAPQPASRG